MLPSISNQDLLQLPKESNKSVKIHCSGTTFDQVMIGRLQDELKYLPLPRGDVCIAKDGIVNLVSIGEMVKARYQVTIDSDVVNVINVSNEDESYIKYVCVQDRLYCFNLDGDGGHSNYLTTVSE